jgi:UDP-glucose 4-epimerase
MLLRKRVLVTGANGYIGSHVVKLLAEHGYNITALCGDYSPNDISKYVDTMLWKSVTSGAGWYNKFDTIVHLAARISVEESVKEPMDYFSVNTMGTDWMITYNEHENFVLASTAAAFDPVSPYAQSKLMAESVVKARTKNYTIFRFFNVAGNNGIFRQMGRATHLIRIAAETAAGKRDKMFVNGTDWDTPDGTCIRDYVHVEDIANAILSAVITPKNTPFECLGSGKGHSNREVINTMKRVSGVDFTVEDAPRRDGDAAIITVPSDKVSDYMKVTGTLEDMCLSAYKMELKK